MISRIRGSALFAGATAFVLTLAAPASAQLALDVDGGGTLGKVTTITVSGAPGTVYVLILSGSGGPTVLPPPHQPTLDVGLELLDLSFAFPGFFGTLPGSGEVSLPIFFTPDPTIDAATLHLQAVRITNNVRIDGKSNKWIVTPDFADSTEPTLGSMNALRAGYATVPLDDGRVLYMGGGADGLVASFGQDAVDAYDPALQTFTALAPMNAPRTSHTATRLNDGRILLTGGADDVMGEPILTAEIYDPVAQTSIPVGNMQTARALHSASLLPDGRVIVMGGTTSFSNPAEIVTNALQSTEIFNPATNAFTPGPNMSRPRVGHTTTTLQNGTLLVAGGFTWIEFIFKIPSISDRAQIYTPATNAPGSFGAEKTMTKARFGQAAVRLANGQVLLAGGATGSNPLNPISDDTAEIYNPTTGQFVADGQLSVARAATTAVALPDGRVVVAGGAFGSLSVPTPSNTVDLYQPGDGATPNSGFVTATFPMQHVRANFTAVLTMDGLVLLAGGGEELDLSNNPISYGDAELLHW